MQIAAFSVTGRRVLVDVLSKTQSGNGLVVECRVAHRGPVLVCMDGECAKVVSLK